MRDTRHWPLRFLAEIVVLVLLAAAFASYRFDLGERWFGSGADPATNPSAVAPPAGLKLPPESTVPAFAQPRRSAAADPAKVAATVRPLLRKRILGPHFAVLVTDLSTGRAVYRVGAPSITPASTTKLLTSTAALETLGPMSRFRTSVRWIPSTHQLVLVGGGDPFLASTPRKGATSFPKSPDLTTLAAQAVRKLRSMNVGRVRLAFDDSYFTGPAVNPTWPPDYLADVVSPISSLWVDEDRSPTGYGFLPDPAAGAAKVFGTALRSDGLTVVGPGTRVKTPTDAAEVAAVSSAPLGEIVERTLEVSDNQAAEVLARHVGLAERQTGSFQAGTASVLDVLARLGVPVTGDVLHDGSGLSRLDRLRPETLAAVLRIVESSAHPDLRSVFTGLPVAGFTGSLAYRFDRGPAQARGRVRAKTGTLTGVHGLAGVADEKTGARLVFVVVADRVPGPKNLEAQALIDRIAGALGACRCGVGSSS